MLKWAVNWWWLPLKEMTVYSTPFYYLTKTKYQVMSEETKTDCFKCKHKREIPGDAHIQCVYPWRTSNINPPAAKQTQWYIMFPYNFDPVWQTESCKGYDAISN